MTSVKVRIAAVAAALAALAGGSGAAAVSWGAAPAHAQHAVVAKDTWTRPVVKPADTWT
jgi:hypothetical protein